jgi:hypothetical protein
MSLAAVIAAGLLAERAPVERADCMSCGREINPARAKLGGRDRFCSARCVDFYDTDRVLIRKVDAYATSPVVLSESARKSRISEAQKRRRKGERKKALATSWERYKAKQREAA